MQRERDHRAGLLVLALQRGQVEVGEHVPVEDHEAIAEQALVGGEPDRARGAERLVLLDVGDLRAPGDLVAERRAQRLGPEAAGHDHLVDPVAAEPVDHVADERAVDERQRRLRLGQRQRAQPRPLPADEHDRLHHGPPDALVGVAGGAQARGIEEVTSVHDQRVRHPAGQLLPIELGELRPLGDQDRRVGALERRGGGVAQLDARQQLPAGPSATGS